MSVALNTSKSHKIYPSEVEQEILLCNAVTECVVTRVNYNESEFLACLYTGEKIPESVIRESLRDKLSKYEIPRRFIHCNSIPRTLNRKISSTKIKNLIIQEMRNHNGEYKE